VSVIDRISKQARRHLGLSVAPQKDYFWETRLAKLILREDYPSREALADSLEAGETRAIDALARHLTTNHTFFFREDRHFEVLPRLLREVNCIRPRIWSAAGSSGEEGYSLAMTLAEAGFLDFLVLVSDVNRRVLGEAYRGVYDEDQMSKVPQALKRKYFAHVGSGRYRVTPELHKHLRFRCLNLIQPLEPLEPLDAIFCRNLLIYFDKSGIQVVLDQLVGSLKPGGLLFLGESEGFHRPPGLVSVAGTSVSRKVST